MSRDEVVGHLEEYAASFRAPMYEQVEVTSLDAAPDSGFRLFTRDGVLRADQVVLATGAYQRPHCPAGAATLPAGLHQIDTEGYRNESLLPPGKVLVVGSGQTGCQLAEELHEAGREVVLACGRAPWSLRRFGDHDIIYWAVDTGMFDETLSELPSPSARLIGNFQATGHGGGHDLHYRVLQQLGVTLVGHFLGARDGRAHFACDLAESVAFGDARYNEIRDRITRLCATRGIAPPEMPDPSPFDPRAPEAVDLAGLGAVIFTSGFRPDYSSWVRCDAFDELGFPIHTNGASTIVSRPLLLRRSLPAKAQVLALDWRRRGRGDRRPDDRRTRRDEDQLEGAGSGHRGSGHGWSSSCTPVSRERSVSFPVPRPCRDPPAWVR